MAKPKPILVVNGPNLNMLGKREPEIYGRASLADIEAAMRAAAKPLGLVLDCRQSNHEGEIVGWLQEARDQAAGIIINPGAYGHHSIAILDALQIAALPTIEVHLSNIHRREHFRRHSFVAEAATGVICGLGAKGYLLALAAMADLVATDGTTSRTRKKAKP